MAPSLEKLEMEPPTKPCWSFQEQAFRKGGVGDVGEIKGSMGRSSLTL